MKSIARSILISLLLIVVGAANAAYDIEWTLGPDHPTLRKGSSAGVFEGAVISAGGIEYPWNESYQVFSYTPGASAWAELPNLPEGRAYTDGIDVGNAFYVCGGRKADSTGTRTRAEVFKLSRNAQNQLAWTQMPSMIQHRGWYGIGSIGAKIIVAGGNKIEYGQALITPTSTLNSVEWFDTANPSAGWQPLAPIPGQSRGWCAGAGLGTKFYLFGGYYRVIQDGTEVPVRVDEALVLDITTNTWSQIANLPRPRSGAHAVVYDNRYIIIIGGYDGGATYDQNGKGWYAQDVLAYDTLNDTYAVMASPLIYATNDIRAAMIDNKIYAIVGENVDPATSNTTRFLRIGEIMELQDTIPPTGSITINDGTRYTSNPIVTLHLWATDNQSGVSDMRFSHDGTNWTQWEAYATTKTWELIAGSGTRAVYVQYRDLAGNECLYIAGIILDTIIPISGTASSPASVSTAPIDVTFSGAGDYGGSGLKEVRLYYKKEQSGTWTDTGLTSSGTSGSFNFTPGDGTGIYYFDLVAEDNAGNKSASASGDGDTITQYSLAGEVQGSITLRDWSGVTEGMPAVIDIGDGSGTTIETKNITLAANGGFDFSTSLTGVYTAVAKAGHWLAKAMPLTITGGSGTVNFNLTNGDCDGDNGIDEIDYAIVSNAWYQAVGDPAYNADADLNGDGGVDEIDYAILSGAWYMAGD